MGEGRSEWRTLKFFTSEPVESSKENLICIVLILDIYSRANDDVVLFYDRMKMVYEYILKHKASETFCIRYNHVFT